MRKAVGHRSRLSAHRGLAAGLAPPSEGAGAAKAAGSSGMDQPRGDPPLQVSADRGSAEPRAPAARDHGYLARWSLLVAACLRRVAGRPIGAGAGARTVAAPRGRPPRRRRPSAPEDQRRPSPSPLKQPQKQAAAVISDDLRQPVRMLRLLQGDVGSGKTVVALLAAAAVTEAGKQAALVGPTAIP